jgi:hypothetical protein
VPLTTDEQYRIVYQAIRGIAEQCDGAVSRDFVGFDGADTKFGRRIAALPYEEWTPEIKSDAAFILGRKYHGQARQVTGQVVDYLDVVREAMEQSDTPWRWAARNQARQAEYAALAKSSRKVTLSENVLSFTFKYDDPTRLALKALGARFEDSDRSWNIYRSRVTPEVSQLVRQFGFTPVDAQTEEFIDQAASRTPTAPTVGDVTTAPDNRLLVTLRGHLGKLAFSEYRQLDGYDWCKGSQQSYVELTERNVRWLAANSFRFAQDPAQLLVTAAEHQADQEATKAASRAETSDRDFTGIFPEGLAPYPFQAAGIDYILNHRRALVGDEMGLGKTIQALGAVLIDQAYPAIVVCPASLKGNWAREIKKWDPDHIVTVLSGRTGDLNLGADWVIVNYDILADWVDDLLLYLNPKALVVDESHYVKSPQTKRSKAVLKLAKGIPASGLVALLTGTPILNRPIELIPQLKVLDKLSDVVPPARRSGNDRQLEYGFRFAYCGAQSNGYGYTFTGSSNEIELNERLRATCMIRRERSQVLGLNDTRRIRIPLALNGALKAYRAAEADAINYILNEVGVEAAQKAMRAETLVRLNLLRRLAEEAKVKAAIEWVEDWLESYPDKSLVIFAEHVVVQRALADHFGCPTILGSQRDVEAQKEVFQTGGSRLIVCSLKAAREGHTLTAASDVVFTGLGWTPGGLQQAEDRCNRIGQEADQVFAWQLSADDTVDDEIAALIEAKRQTFDAVVKGQGEGTVVDTDPAVVAGAIDYLIRKGQAQNRGGNHGAGGKGRNGGGRSPSPQQVAKRYRSLARMARGGRRKGFGW